MYEFRTLVPEHYDASTDYVYDTDGNLTSRKFRKGGLTGPIICTVNYTYDTDGNLTSEVRVNA